MIYTTETMAQALANMENQTEINKHSLFVKLAMTEEAANVIELRRGLESALFMLMASGYGCYEDETRAISIILQSLEFGEKQITL